jgi:ribosomal protein L21E
MNIHVSDMTSSFDRGNIVHLTINRAFRPASFTPLHAEGPWRLEEVDGGKTVLTVDLSKVDPVYIGEPVHIAAIANE